MEDNTTAFLVRSTSEEWKRGSVLAVDAGVHLSAISAILDQYLPAERNPSEKYTISTGPFTGLELPYVSAKANAAHFTRTIVDTYLITHPHLDHISGLVVNTAALPGHARSASPRFRAQYQPSNTTSLTTSSGQTSVMKMTAQDW